VACMDGTSGKIRFVFADSGNLGPQIELEFERGAALAASALFASQKYLRIRMSELANEREKRKHRI
jgi:hypothetical protein